MLHVGMPQASAIPPACPPATPHGGTNPSAAVGCSRLAAHLPTRPHVRIHCPAGCIGAFEKALEVLEREPDTHMLNQFENKVGEETRQPLAAAGSQHSLQGGQRQPGAGTTAMCPLPTHVVCTPPPAGQSRRALPHHGPRDLAGHAGQGGIGDGALGLEGGQAPKTASEPDRLVQVNGSCFTCLLPSPPPSLPQVDIFISGAALGGCMRGSCMRHTAHLAIARCSAALLLIPPSTLPYPGCRRGDRRHGHGGGPLPQRAEPRHQGEAEGGAGGRQAGRQYAAPLRLRHGGARDERCSRASLTASPTISGPSLTTLAPVAHTPLIFQIIAVEPTESPVISGGKHSPHLIQARRRLLQRMHQGFLCCCGTKRCLASTP